MGSSVLPVLNLKSNAQCGGAELGEGLTVGWLPAVV